jgi:hypothetical protein
MEKMGEGAENGWWSLKTTVEAANKQCMGLEMADGESGHRWYRSG